MTEKTYIADGVPYYGIATDRLVSLYAARFGCSLEDAANKTLNKADRKKWRERKLATKEAK